MKDGIKKKCDFEVSEYLLAVKIKSERYAIQSKAFVKGVEELNRNEKLLGKSYSVKRVNSMVYWVINLLVNVQEFG